MSYLVLQRTAEIGLRLALGALLAALSPAQRAARVDEIIALRG